VWEIRRGEDYDVATENMRVNLHMRASAESRRVRTQKITDDHGEGLVFQFLPSDVQETVTTAAAQDPEGARAAMAQLYQDTLEIYDRAREEVTFERSDGIRVPYVATRYKQMIDRCYADDALVPAIARIVRRPTLGFGHLADAGRPDLMLETLILDASKPYHRFFSAKTIRLARDRMDDYHRRHAT
jgi:hypothetical protein